ncbi:MAG: hypothetical protein ABI045_02210 [Flavobacteriales bacterium]
MKHTEQLIERFRYKPSNVTFAQNLIKRLEKLGRTDTEEEGFRQINIRFIPSITPGKVILEIENISKKNFIKNIFFRSVFFCR